MTVSAELYLAFLSPAYSKAACVLGWRASTAVLLHQGVQKSLEFPSRPKLQVASSSPVVVVVNDIWNTEVWTWGWIKGKWQRLAARVQDQDVEPNQAPGLNYAAVGVAGKKAKPWKGQPWAFGAVVRAMQAEKILFVLPFLQSTRKAQWCLSICHSNGS